MLATLSLVLLLPIALEDAADWPAWRGPSGNGVASGAAPTSWSEEENVRWKVPIPGRGVSTPIVLGRRLFLTTAVSVADDSEEQSYELHCLERSSGATLWRQVARVARPHEGFHKSYGSHASASPVSDGERIFVSFGSQGVFAWDLEGKLAWSFDPGVKMTMRNGFGEGLAPVLAGDVLIQVVDQEQDSFAFALDKKSGKELWRVARDEPSGWSTPLVTTFDDVLQVVTTGARRTRSYDVRSGEVLWEGVGAGLNAIPTVLRHADRVLIMSGFREAKILSLDPGAAADEKPARWKATKGCGYTASAVLHDGLYYTVTDRGLISCFDAETGEAHYLEERLPRGSTLKSSPIAAGELLYVPTEAGEVHLIRLGPEYEVVGTMALADQVFIASPVAVEGELYLRSLTHLVCIAEEGG